nr:MAG TPA: C2H2 type zinc-finger protein [Caudoviricetes sp.]
MSKIIKSCPLCGKGITSAEDFKALAKMIVRGKENE